MFTGIIQDLVKIEKITKTNSMLNDDTKDISDKNRSNLELTINFKKFKKLKIGDSVALNGVCLTVAKLHKNLATFQLIDETIRKSSFSYVRQGDKVNVERSLKIGRRLEGHFVLGHVDCIGKITHIEKNISGSIIQIEIMDNGILHLIASKGSITIDGVSLTVVKIIDRNIEIALIPHTLENTTLGIKQEGDYVNIEADMLARYISNIYQNTGNNKKNSNVY